MLALRRLCLDFNVSALKVFPPLAQSLVVQIRHSPDLQVRLRIVHANHAYHLLQRSPLLDWRRLATEELSPSMEQLVGGKAPRCILGLVWRAVPFLSLQTQELVHHAVAENMLRLNFFDLHLLAVVLRLALAPPWPLTCGAAAAAGTTSLALAPSKIRASTPASWPGARPSGTGTAREVQFGRSASHGSWRRCATTGPDRSRCLSCNLQGTLGSCGTTRKLFLCLAAGKVALCKASRLDTAIRSEAGDLFEGGGGACLARILGWCSYTDVRRGSDGDS
jgi:hypothetical protein